MHTISWNMRDVPEPERFAYWREAVCQTYLPLEPEDLCKGMFDGRIDGAAGASLHISRVRSMPATVARTRRGIATFQDGSFYANLQVRGEAVVEQFGQRAIARPGDIVLVDTNEPFSIRFEEVCDLVCATLPDTGLRRRLRHLGRAPVSVISNTGAGRLASAYLHALRDIPADFELVDDLAGHQLTALLTRAASLQLGHTVAPSRREVRARRILDFVNDELDNPLLSAKFVCRELALSRSTLFEILSDAGITFASHIRKARLDRSVAQIRDSRFAHVAIGEIALRAGFASQESFTRAFRRRFGIAPGAMRSRRET